MFLVRLKKVRVKIANRRIEKFVRNSAYKWLEKQRANKRQIIFDFLKWNADNEGKVNMQCLKYFKSISKIQVMVRRFLI